MKTTAWTINNFTTQARAALVAALHDAMRLGDTFLEPEHLLVGILSQPSGMAAQVLQGLGVEQEFLCESAAALLQPHDQPGREAHLSPRTKSVIAFAVSATIRMRQGALDTDHLLLGILHEEDSDACNLLHSWGVNLEVVYAGIIRLRSQDTIEQIQEVSSPASQPEDASSGPLLLEDQDAPPVDSVSATNNAVALDTRQQQAIAYMHSRQRARGLYLLVIAIVTAVVTTFALLSSQFSVWLGALESTLASTPMLNWQPLAGWWPLLVLAYFVLISIPLLAVSIPLAWYTGLVIPRRYGLRQETTLSWLGELGKGLSMLCVQVWLLVEVVALFRAIQPQTWWAWAALVQFLYSVLKARFAPLWLHPLLSNAEPLPEGELNQRLHALLTRLHIPVCGIFQVRISHRMSAANAFFVGWGKGRRIILTDTLIQHLTPDEIEVILAHELGHLVHHDIWTRLAIRGLTFLSVFFFLYLYLAMLTTLVSSSSLLALIQPLLLLLFVVLFLVFLRLTTRYRRRQEYQADEFALQTTRNVQAFKSAMTQLTNMNLLVAAPTRRGQHPTSHPALVKRLKHADEFAASHGISAKT